jgi:hypothetical protein
MSEGSRGLGNEAASDANATPTDAADANTDLRPGAIGNKMGEIKPGDYVAAYLAQYNSLRGEIQNRLGAQQQAFQYLVGVLTAAIGALAAAKGLNLDPNQLILALPIIVAPLGFILFDNEIMVFEAGSHAHRMRTRISQLLNDEALLADGHPLCRRHKLSRLTHPLLSVGRWLLFLIPAIGSTLYATIAGWGDWLWKLPYPLILVVDIMVSILLLLGALAAGVEQYKWRWPDSSFGRRLHKSRGESCF